MIRMPLPPSSRWSTPRIPTPSRRCGASPRTRSAATGAIVAVSHRVGRLEVGDAAVVIAVASSHRAEAFDVCRAIIETIKTDLPVWKRQIEADGTTAWKGLGG